MGYGMTQEETSIFIAARDLPALHRGLKAMWQYPKIMGGGSSTGERWFSFCNGANPETDTLPELLAHIRWDPTFDADGNMTDLQFSGEKLGDENRIFRVLAPVVKVGSFITMRGEDGDRWRWIFDGTDVEEVHGETVFPAQPEPPSPSPPLALPEPSETIPPKGKKGKKGKS